jgi:hypothetical protein
MTRRPARRVAFDEALGVVSQGLADPEDRPKLVAPDTGDRPTVVGRLRDLIEIPGDRAELA